MEEIYKNWKIEYYEGLDAKFVAKKDDYELDSKTLKEIKSAIDQHIKKAFKRIPCFYKGYDGIVEAEITSVFKTYSDGTIRGVYISIKNGTTRKVDNYSLKDLFMRSDKNKQLFKEIHELKEAAKKLDEDISSKEQKLEKMEFEKQC